MHNVEGVKEKEVIQIVVKRVLELDGTDSMEKIIIIDDIVEGTVEEIMEKVKRLVEKARQDDFRFL